MMYQSFGYSFILACLYFSLYPFASGETMILCLAGGLMLVGAAAEIFLLRKRKRGFWIPALCIGAEAVIEVIFHLNEFGILHSMAGHAVWECVLVGVAALYILLGALIGWTVNQVRSRYRARRTAGQAA